MKISFLSFAACLLFALMIPGSKLSFFGLFRHDINITYSENISELRIQVTYPLVKAPEVNALVNDHFKMLEQIDLNRIELKSYLTPDHQYNLNLKSKPGVLKIVLPKSNNTPSALQQFKEFGNKLKVLLVE